MSNLSLLVTLDVLLTIFVLLISHIYESNTGYSGPKSIVLPGTIENMKLVADGKLIPSPAEELLNEL